jgi:hypothetical protein
MIHEVTQQPTQTVGNYRRMNMKKSRFLTAVRDADRPPFVNPAMKLQEKAREKARKELVKMGINPDDLFGPPLTK